MRGDWSGDGVRKGFLMGEVLRSDNVQVTLLNVTDGMVVAGVQYHGVVRQAVTLLARAVCVVLVGGASLGLRSGFRVVRTSQLAHLMLSEIRTHAPGELIEVPMAGVVDLEPGDAIQLWLHATVSGRVALIARGWTVVVL